MTKIAEQPVLDFHTYPSVGDEDWQYAFQAAQVRSLETHMLSRATLLDMVNAGSFEQAADLLSGTEYALPQGGRNFAEVEDFLLQRRTAVRQLFADLMLDERVVELFKARTDYANMRLAVRRTLTEKPLGTDYSNDGNIPPELFEQIFGEESKFDRSLVPDYVYQAAEQAILSYYQNKDIRQVDYIIDSAQAQHNLKQAYSLKSVFLLNLFRIQIDLTNIRTMLRLKFTDSEQRNVFLPGGYIEIDQLKYGIEHEYETLDSLFYATPYNHVVHAGANYLVKEKSFLRLEQHCEEYLTGFLRSTSQITAGPQPVIAYLLMKENEIRTVRLILTAKKNHLDTKLILDRIS
jgi:V/A-type H+-transporting ATPase subunit C